MTQKWILDVLVDLKKFAALNGLDALAQQLNVTHRVACAELDDLNERPIIGSTNRRGERRPQAERIGTRYRA